MSIKLRDILLGVFVGVLLLSCAACFSVKRTPMPLGECSRSEVIEQCFKNIDLDEVEGIWELTRGDAGFELAVIKNTFQNIPNADYIALILDTNRGGWIPGETKLLIRKTAQNHLYLANYFMDRSSKEPYRTKLTITGSNSALLSHPTPGVLPGTRRTNSGFPMVRIYPEASAEQPSPLEENPTQGFSKYDDFLNAVVIVRVRDGHGSGFFVSPDGYLITNHHVVENERTVSIRLRNGMTSFAEVLKVDKGRDLALLKMNVTDKCPWLALGSTADTSILDEVIAIGSPKSETLGWSVTKGVISEIRQDGGREVVQTDAAVNKGNSGGPLISLASGKVIGVNTFAWRKDETEGLNFAVSANDVRKAFSGVLR